MNKYCPYISFKYLFYVRNYNNLSCYHTCEGIFFFNLFFPVIYYYYLNIDIFINSYVISYTPPLIIVSKLQNYIKNNFATEKKEIIEKSELFIEKNGNSLVENDKLIIGVYIVSYKNNKFGINFFLIKLINFILMIFNIYYKC